MKFGFGDTVMVDGQCIGVVCKCYEHKFREAVKYSYDIYVREYNAIRNYMEDAVKKSPEEGGVYEPNDSIYKGQPDLSSVICLS